MEWMTRPGRFGHLRYVGDSYFSDGIDAISARDDERVRRNKVRRIQGLFEYAWSPDLMESPREPEELEEAERESMLRSVWAALA
jgi:hypothetical protein